ncbi:hypothetical protein NE237_017113 [Protea cynaroides]|uniref:Pentatricopeptide repeat-containing protein n=1 Tax=Protea cynaroides TaxID=273540 RepID=A0A9Q0QMR8_9MAGN|nr:hypothetical protein NE237_017113 [Protea cynaroides]
MRNGKTLSFTLLGTSSELANILLVASLSKTLSESGTRNLDADSIPLSESIVLQILRRNSLDTSKKLDFFRWASLRPGYKHSSNTYSQVFHAICRSGCLDELPPLLRLMKEDGVVVDSATFKLLLDSFIRSGKFDSALEILDDMEELGTNLNPHMYNSVVIALVRKNQVGLALSMFYKVLEALNGDGAIVPDAIACNELLVALRKADMRVEFRMVFEKLREKSGFLMDTWGYNICIHVFGCWGDLGMSLKLFKEMKEKALSLGSPGPDLCTYNSLIRVLCLVGKVKDALIVWEELKGSGCEPDAFTHRILIQGCCKSYRVDDATRIFSEMQYNGCRPDTVVYNSLLDGLFKARRLTEACQLFEKMIQDGVRASCWSYNILIDGLFKNGRAAAGYTLFCDLKKKGQLVDCVTYSIVVQHLCKEGQLEGAFDLVSEMEARGFVVDLVTMTSLLIGLHKQGRWDWAEKLLKHVRDGTLVSNVIRWRYSMEASIRDSKSRKKDFTSMFSSKTDLAEILGLTTSSSNDPFGSNVDATDEGGQTLGNPFAITDQWSSSPYMDKLANEMKAVNRSFLSFSVSKGQRVQESGIGSFNTDMINTYLSIFLAKGNLSLACKLFEIFTEMGVNPVGYSYNSMMSSFVKKGYFNEAWSVLHEMGEKLCPADIATYNVVIQGLGKMGRADLASAVLDQLMEHGGYLDIVMYNTLIHALGRAGRIDEANKLFEQMKTSGINPDVVTFNTLIEVHSKAGQVKEAYKFLKMMLDAGCSPNYVTDTTLDFLEKEIEKIRYQKASIKRHSNKENEWCLLLHVVRESSAWVTCGLDLLRLLMDSDWPCCSCEFREAVVADLVLFEGLAIIYNLALPVTFRDEVTSKLGVFRGFFSGHLLLAGDGTQSGRISAPPLLSFWSDPYALASGSPSPPVALRVVFLIPLCTSGEEFPLSRISRRSKVMLASTPKSQSLTALLRWPAWLLRYPPELLRGGPSSDGLCMVSAIFESPTHASPLVSSVGQLASPSLVLANPFAILDGSEFVDSLLEGELLPAESTLLIQATSPLFPSVLAMIRRDPLRSITLVVLFSPRMAPAIAQPPPFVKVGAPSTLPSVIRRSSRKPLGKGKNPGKGKKGAAAGYSQIKGKNLAVASSILFRDWKTSHNSANKEAARDFDCLEFDALDVGILSSSPETIHCRLTRKDSNKCLYCSAIYASNSRDRRCDFWSEIDLAATNIKTTGLCLLLGI